MKYFDAQKKRLIVVETEALAGFWDSHWQADSGIRERIAGIKKNFVTDVTKKYLKPEDGIILEAGCGMGVNVAALSNNGYKCIGLDNAEKTVRILNRYAAEFDIRLADVRSIPFDDGYFAGCWSWGVIEHFWDGFEPVASEMARVVKEGGNLFLVFPSMSPIRRLKSRLGLYKLWGGADSKGFYQYILNPEEVISVFEKTGFNLIKAKHFDAIKGLKSEIGILTLFLQRLYDYKGRSIFLRGVKRCLEALFSALAGHSILLIFKKASSCN